ncbi:unnamed protein product [Trichobilharzia regenti]|nr:unnamed protein product [Trichobilharzia regenti]
MWVNGQDLRNATHEEAIQAFQKAKEPIIVEVARRDPNAETVQKSTGNTNSTNSNNNNFSSLNKCSVAIQTDPSTAEATLAAMAAAALTTEDIQYDTISDMKTDGTNDGNIWESLSSSQRGNIRIKEVTLCRKTMDEKFGLTLCYRQGDTCDASCDVFVGDLEFDSLASQSGQISSGDQILRINGQVIKSREHVIDLFQQSKSKVVLLIAQESGDSCEPAKNNKSTVNSGMPTASDSTMLTTTTTTTILDGNAKMESESVGLSAQESQTCSSLSVKELSSNEFCASNDFSSSMNKDCSDFVVSLSLI